MPCAFARSSYLVSGTEIKAKRVAAMTSIFSKIASFFGGNTKADAPQRVHEQEIEGYRVVATPMREGAQFRVAGRIEKEEGSRVMVRNFIRADVFGTEDDAVEASFRKAGQVITQSRGQLFADGADEGRV
jgi:hypothetical protein